VNFARKGEIDHQLLHQPSKVGHKTYGLSKAFIELSLHKDAATGFNLGPSEQVGL